MNFFDSNISRYCYLMIAEINPTNVSVVKYTSLSDFHVFHKQFNKEKLCNMCPCKYHTVVSSARVSALLTVKRQL